MNYPVLIFQATFVVALICLIFSLIIMKFSLENVCFLIGSQAAYYATVGMCFMFSPQITWSDALFAVVGALACCNMARAFDLEQQFEEIKKRLTTRQNSN